MTAIGVGVRLWFRTVLLTGLLIPFVWAFTLHGDGGLLCLATLTIGFVITSPLLLLIVPVVTISGRLPYNNSSRISFVTFMLALIIMFFYGIFGWIVDDCFYCWGELLNLASSTIIALLLTVVSVRRSFLKLYASL